jgi:hypothetical protein
MTAPYLSLICSVKCTSDELYALSPVRTLHSNADCETFIFSVLPLASPKIELKVCADPAAPNSSDFVMSAEPEKTPTSNDRDRKESLICPLLSRPPAADSRLVSQALKCLASMKGDH